MSLVINFFLTVDEILQEKEDIEAQIKKYGEPSGCLCAEFDPCPDWNGECDDSCHCDAVNYVQELFPVLDQLEKALNEYLEDWYDMTGAIWEIKNVISWSKPRMINCNTCDLFYRCHSDPSIKTKDYPEDWCKSYKVKPQQMSQKTDPFPEHLL